MPKSTNQDLSAKNARNVLDNLIPELAKLERQAANARLMLRSSVKTSFDLELIERLGNTYEEAEKNRRDVAELVISTHETLVEAELAEKGEELTKLPYVRLAGTFGP